MTCGAEGANVGCMYEISILGRLPSDWEYWFDGFESTTITSGCGPLSTLTGPIADQPALHGLLQCIRDLNLEIVSVNRVRVDRPIGPNTSPDT